MDTAIWLPGLVVLGAGLTAGLLIAIKLWRGKRGSHGKLLQADLILRLADLRERRDDLYGRLKRVGPRQPMGAERATLEEQAARTLREIDEVQKELVDLGGAPQVSEETSRKSVPATPETESSPPPVAAHSRAALIGFLGGIGAAALIGLLIYYAVRDATPKPEMQGGTQVASEEAPHPTAEGLNPADEAQLDSLLARVLSDPTDLIGRKELALFQLSRNLFVEAFENSKKILAQSPQDPDGLYIQGVVRVTMGQYDLAINMFDQVLADYPDHVQALLYRGISLFQGGETTQAIDTWEVALEMAGGSHPDIEYLLETATGNVVATNNGQLSQKQAPRPQQDGYQLHIELASEARSAPGATLFIYLKAEDSGPPAAVRRITSPSFPLDVTIGPGDTMIADTNLPPAGTLFVRLDADGSASTKDATDLEAQASAAINSRTTLVLKP